MYYIFYFSWLGCINFPSFQIELKPAAVPGTNKHGEGPDLKSADSKCANEPTEMLNHSNESEETKETIPSTSANAATMEKIQSVTAGNKEKI